MTGILGGVVFLFSVLFIIFIFSSYDGKESLLKREIQEEEKEIRKMITKEKYIVVYLVGGHSVTIGNDIDKNWKIILDSLESSSIKYFKIKDTVFLKDKIIMIEKKTITSVKECD